MANPIEDGQSGSRQTSSTAPGEGSGSVTDSYPLSPMQSGMLFHSVSEVDRGVDLMQTVVRLREPLDEARFLSAWSAAAARHAVLRTRFRWQGVAQPVQEVLDRVRIPVERMDWRTEHAETREIRLQEYVDRDRRRGIDIGVAPLMRLALITAGDDEHWLLWTYHHAILDGRSRLLLLREIFAAYEAQLRGEEPALGEPRPYRDYINWVHAIDHDRSRDYWQCALSGVSAPTPLIVARERDIENVEGNPWGSYGARCSAELSASLRTLARDASITVNTLLQGAWALLLHRYSGERDIVFGATRACRRSVPGSADDMIGMFINTLPLRVRVDPDAELGPWLRSLREQQVALREYEHTPLVKVQAWSDVPRGTPLFETILVYENQTLDTRLRALGGPWSRRRFAVTGQANVPLVLNAWGDEAIMVQLDFSRRRFADDSIKRMHGHLRTLLEGMAACPSARLKDLTLLTHAERRQALEWNPGLSCPRNGCLHERFEGQVQRTPDAIALSGEGVRLTYDELNRRANRVARRLRTLGVQPNDLVGLRVERNPEMVIGILGILKSGAAYLPLDPAYPKDRVAFMLEDSKVAVVATQRSLAPELAGLAACCLLLDGEFSEDDTDPAAVGHADDLAYVIYTSGSTGKPKGVLITHYNVTRLFDATQHWYRFDRHDVWTLFHSYAFDFSVWELWGALLHGGRLVLVPYWVSRSPAAFRELLVTERVTVLNQTPSAFRQLVQVDAAESQADYALRYVIFGGEALELSMLRPWFQRYRDAQPRLVNMYGITETTVHVTYRPIRSVDLESGQGSVIGVPIPDLQVYILDPYGEPAPIGVSGEIHVGGAGVARGYLNRPELTEARFIPDRFNPASGTRLYRSGDLARRLASGDIEFLGRIDHQVKIRGFRIELGEIEAGIARHPAVRAVTVMTREDHPGDKRLVAYVVADQAPSDLINQLRAGLRSDMPEYMVPAHFVALDALPLTENGKVDRKALPAPDAKRVVRDALIAPRTPAEKTLAAIWSAVLGVEPIGIHDNFFELGGDSILSIQVIARAREAGLAIAPKQLFQNPTIERLAPLALATPAAAAAEQHTLTGSVPLTPVQCWFFERGFVDVHHWNQAFLFEIDGALDRSRLETAVTALLRHHDALRLRFTRHGDEWRQEYSFPEGAAPLAWISLDGVREEALAPAIEQAVGPLQSMLSLSGPLLYVAHIDCGRNRGARLAVIVHHLAVDGVSWRILIEDLMQAYAQGGNRRDVRLPAKTTSYRRWSESLRDYARSDRMAAEREYWRSVLQGPFAQLPIDFHGAGPNAESSLETISVKISPEETRALLHRVPKAYGTQVNDVLLAALVLSSAAWNGGAPMLVDVEGHGREDIGADIDIARTVGWFTSIFPVALRPCGSNISDTLASVKETLRKVPQKGLGYGVLRYLSPERLPVPAHTPEILFNYFGQFDQVVAGVPGLRFARERCAPWRSPHAARTHTLQITAIVLDGALEVRWHYSRNLHRGETIERMAAAYVGALRDIAGHCLAITKRRYTPSDFPLAHVNQNTLDHIAAQANGIQDLYPLAPMQRLFYSMEAAGSKLGFEQWHFVLEGALDACALQKSWQQVLSRHPVLRTTFVNDALAEPLQLVHEEIAVPWTAHDWRGSPPEEQATRLQQYVDAERELGFNLGVSPLTRVALIRTADSVHHMLWSTHHLHVDGWSWPLIFRDLDEYYRAETRGTSAALAPPCPYRAYIEWTQCHPFGQSETFWRNMLLGVAEPTPLAFECADAGDDRDSNRHGTHAVALSRADTEALQTFARERRITLNTLVQAAWGLLLSHLSMRDDVIFGAACSGRPTDIPGIETMVGPCVNNVPVRVAVPRSGTLGAWLTALQDTQSEVSEHQYASLDLIQRWSAVPPRLRLFESLVVFQNYDGGEAPSRLGESVAVRTLSSPDATSYPFTLVVRPGPILRLKLIYRERRADRAAMVQVLEALGTLLATISQQAADAPGEIANRLPASMRGMALRGRSTATRARLPYTAPASDMERQVAAIWKELFEVDDISLEENFFDLGGHSLLLVRAHQRLREVLRSDVNIVALLQYPTIRALARHLDEGPGRATLHDVIRERARKQRSARARRTEAVRT